jgi:large subunit ribosomal protein L29
MKVNELRDLNLQELQEKKSELNEELFNLKMRHSLNQLDNPIQIRHLRRDLARVRTLIEENQAKLS